MHQRKLWFAILPLLITVVTLIALIALSMYVLSAVRAYVGGEGLWSKSQKDAVFHLVRYAATADDADFAKYEKAIAVPLGDRKAREALDRARGEIDYEGARQGFLQGRNHPDDVASLSFVFVHFRQLSYIAKAIEIWEEGDRLIAGVVRDAAELRAEIRGSRDPERIERIVGSLRSLNEQMMPLEDAFSYTLGEASRRTRDLLVFVSAVLGALLLGAGVAVYAREFNRSAAAEAALRESRNLLSLAMHGSRMGAWSRDIATGKTWWSPEQEEIFGLARGGFKGTEAAFFEFVHEDDRRAVTSAIEAALATRKDYVVEFRFRHASGEWRWMEGRGKARYAADGRPVALHGIGIDITERKRAAESLVVREERYRALFESIDEGFSIIELIFDAGGNVVDYRFSEVNPAFEKQTGLRNAAGKRIRELVPDHDPHWFEIYGRVAVTGEPVRVVNEARAMGRWFDVYASRIGESRRTVALLCTDITERRRAEDKLQRLAGDLAGANRRKDEFLAVLAHELRNPLAPIRSAVSIMRLHRPLPHGFGEVLEIVDRQARHLTRLVDDLLEVSRITQGKLQLRKERMALSRPLEDAVEAIAAMVESAGQELTVELPPEPLQVDGDGTRITQICVNLLNNAIKFTPRGGHIRLLAERQGNEALIRVRDDGIGIQPENLPRLYEMFSQLSPILERTHGGLGIGLALVRGLVELHGGTVEAHSAGLGQGSEFVIRLPLAQPSTQPGTLEPVRPAPGSGAQQRRRVLVVDDNVDAARSLKCLVELMGHDVLEVHDGPQAIRAARDYRPDLVLLDIGLPGMNGYDAAREIRRHAPATIKLVAVTGWGQQEDKRRSREAGFDLHVTKPVELATLESLLQGGDAGDRTCGRPVHAAEST